MRIFYEPHPISPERKAELRTMGYKILDERFYPGPKPTAPVTDFTREGVAAMDKADVVELIEAHGGKADGRKSVERLREELIEIMFIGGADADG